MKTYSLVQPNNVHVIGVPRIFVIRPVGTNYYHTQCQEIDNHLYNAGSHLAGWNIPALKGLVLKVICYIRILQEY